MKTNMWVRIICVTLTLIALAGAIFFHYCYKEPLFLNICLAIFGSALLTYINALVSYKVIQREAIMQYLTDLRRYRNKFKNTQAASADSRTAYLEDLSDFSYELFSDYSKIQHLCKNLFIHKGMSDALDCSFENIRTVQDELNRSYLNFPRQKSKVNDAVEKIEKLARNKKYLNAKEEGQM